MENEKKEKIEAGLKEINDLMDEIDILQDKVEDVIYSKNPFKKFFRYNKALDMHEEATKKLIEVNMKLVELMALTRE